MECAAELKQKLSTINLANFGLKKVEAVGPYVNFYLDSRQLAKNVLAKADKKDFGKNKIGKGKKIMVEFAHPNTHKAFHIGHLRNITTGESLCRIFDNAGYKVTRVNYQGDVGLHIAKCMYGILNIKNWILDIKKLKNVKEKVKFLSEAYAAGNKAYEDNEKAKKEIETINEKIYNQNDKKINKIYAETRKWSLNYFAQIYQRVGTKFDKLYFESEVYKRGRELVAQGVKDGILKQSEGAVIFEGEKYGLHNRVFLNSLGLPTYEAKDLALAEKQLKDYQPDYIFHVVAKEQTEYFKVLFKALEYILPKSKDKEKHLIYGWVSLKEGKMSSRTGNVVLGEWLLDKVKEKINEIVADHEIKNKKEVAEKVAVAAVKYSYLRTSAVNDIVFSIDESVSLIGDSGPYLLYIVARINSILRQADKVKKINFTDLTVDPAEHKLLLSISQFVDKAQQATKDNDPSVVAHYLLQLAQDFNNFYNICPVLKAPEQERDFRLHLITITKNVMVRGLYLLGIETVSEM